MPFQKGRAKTGGRVPGGNQVQRDLSELLNSMHCNPFEGLAKIAQDSQNPIAVRRQAYADLAGYLKPKLKAIEHTGSGGGPIQIDVSPRERLDNRIARIAERRRAS